MKQYGIIFLGLLTLAIISTGCGSDSSVAKADNKEEVVNALSKDIEKDLGNPELYYKRAQYSYEKEEYDNAIDDLEKAISLDSLVPNYYHLLSDAYLDYYRSKDALIVMVKAASLFPHRIPTLLKLSETQLILKMNEPSLETVARIFIEDPDNPDGHFMKGMNFRAMGEIDRAINAFQTVTELDPEMMDAWLMSGDLFFEKGLPIARSYYDAAINLEPENITALHSLAYYLQNNNDDNGAIKLYRKIISLDKNYMDAYLNTGILYMSMDSLPQAKEQFNIMASIQPTNHLPYFYRGLIHEAEGNIDMARKDIQSCINLKSDFNRAREVMSRLQEG